MGTSPPVKRVASWDELKPVIALCKAGKLFEVQDWIAAGKPLDGPQNDNQWIYQTTPLKVAVKLNFHSLMKVLLEGGAYADSADSQSAFYSVIASKKLELIDLFVEHGVDPAAVDMRDVFETWEPKVMEYFIERGAKVEENNSFAYAFIERIRTAVGRFKPCLARNPQLIEQANIALRNHCKNGNLKWVALMLWLGADPYKVGVSDWNDVESNSDTATAVELAAERGHHEVFNIKTLPIDVSHQPLRRNLGRLCQGGGLAVVRRLLELGLDPNDKANGGSWAIDLCVCFAHSVNEFGDDVCWSQRKDLDSPHAREKMRAVTLLAMHGAKWVTDDNRDLKDFRSDFFKLVPWYTFRFIQIMTTHRACSLASMKDFLNSPKMKARLKPYWAMIKVRLMRLE